MSHISNSHVNGYQIDAGRSPVVVHDRDGATVATFHRLADAELFIGAKTAAQTSAWDNMLAAAETAAAETPDQPRGAGQRLMSLIGIG